MGIVNFAKCNVLHINCGKNRDDVSLCDAVRLVDVLRVLTGVSEFLMYDIDGLKLEFSVIWCCIEVLSEGRVSFTCRCDGDIDRCFDFVVEHIRKGLLVVLLGL